MAYLLLVAGIIVCAVLSAGWQGFTLALLELGGLPPLAGFMSKWQIFVAGTETQNWMITVLVVFAALNSVLPLAVVAIGLWPGLVSWLTEPAGAAIVAVFSR